VLLACKAILFGGEASPITLLIMPRVIASFKMRSKMLTPMPLVFHLCLCLCLCSRYSRVLRGQKERKACPHTILPSVFWS